MSKYTLDFVTLGCNRVAGCVDWGNDNTVAFGGGNFVALFDVEGGRITHTLPGHVGRVNSLKWLSSKNFHSFKSDEKIVSASSDSTLIVWSKVSSEVLVREDANLQVEYFF